MLPSYINSQTDNTFHIELMAFRVQMICGQQYLSSSSYCILRTERTGLHHAKRFGRVRCFRTVAITSSELLHAARYDHLIAVILQDEILCCRTKNISGGLRRTNNELRKASNLHLFASSTGLVWGQKLQIEEERWRWSLPLLAASFLVDTSSLHQDLLLVT